MVIHKAEETDLRSGSASECMRAVTLSPIEIAV